MPAPRGESVRASLAQFADTSTEIVLAGLTSFASQRLKPLLSNADRCTS